MLNTILNAQEADSKAFLLENKKKLQYLGAVSQYYDVVPMSLNPDGSVTAHLEEDKELEKRINRTNKLLKVELQPLVEFIEKAIFKGKAIQSQELILDDDLKILALCDLSTEDAVLEIKTGKPDPSLYAEQIYYEAQGRDAYLLCFEWDADESILPCSHETLDLIIYKVYPAIGVKPNKRRDGTIAKLNNKLKAINAEVEQFENTSKPILLKCHVCNQTWLDSYNRISSGRAACAICHPELAVRKRNRNPAPKVTLSPEEKMQKRIDKYAAKVSERSDDCLTVDKDSYTGSKEPIRVKCNTCGYIWTPRADHLLSRCYCPKCK